MSAPTAGDLAEHLRAVEDFPRPGVRFWDAGPLLRSPRALRAAVDALAALCPPGTTAVAGVEARGFLLGTPLALALDAGFVAVRKPGKLPGRVLERRYDLEYGSDALQVQAGAVGPGDRLVVLDDVLATGGTAAAACALLESSGAAVAAAVFLLELPALGGRAALGGRTVASLLRR